MVYFEEKEQRLVVRYYGETVWLDEAEPEFTEYAFDIVRNYEGPHCANGKFFLVEYAKNFYEGMKAEGQENIINLLRCAWAGSQRYGALVWLGDIQSSFESMRAQITAGLNMGIAGIPWWTTDIGGFYGGCGSDPAFQELFARWFAYGAFCPVMRLHGFRLPKLPPLGEGEYAQSGADNEVWSFGEQNYSICKKYLAVREQRKPYIKKQMQAAHEKETLVIRPQFYDFPEDSKCWEQEDSYLFGPELLVAPVTQAGATSREVYLPANTAWRDFWSGKTYEGGQTVRVPAPIDVIPVFIREGADIAIAREREASLSLAANYLEDE